MTALAANKWRPYGTQSRFLDGDALDFRPHPYSPWSGRIWAAMLCVGGSQHLPLLPRTCGVSRARGLAHGSRVSRVWRRIRFLRSRVSRTMRHTIGTRPLGSRLSRVSRSRGLSSPGFVVLIGSRVARVSRLAGLKVSQLAWRNVRACNVACGSRSLTTDRFIVRPVARLTTEGRPMKSARSEATVAKSSIEAPTTAMKSVPGE